MIFNNKKTGEVRIKKNYDIYHGRGKKKEKNSAHYMLAHQKSQVVIIGQYNNLKIDHKNRKNVILIPVANIQMCLVQIISTLVR